MPFEIIESSSSVMTVRVMRELKKSELDRIQAAALEAIKQWGKIRVLIILDNFRGWEASPDWGDVTFMSEHSKEIEKIAIVGEEMWKDQAYAFTGKGFRPTAIEYFGPFERDRAASWLAES